MRFVTLASVALATTPALVAADGTLGFALGTKKKDGTCKYQSDYEEDFDAILAESGSTLVRGYSASDCNFAENVLPAAQKKGFKVVMGIWPDVQKSFDDDTAAIKKGLAGNEGAIEAITVGSETLYRKTFKGPQLLSKIQQVQEMFPNVKVGTADSWNKFADGTADAVIQGGVDYFLVNAFGYWQGQEINNATATYFDDIMQAFTHIQEIGKNRKSLDLWTGETGWPSDGGSDYGSAVAGTDNAQTFYESAICGMLIFGYNVYFFEAFDEPWKPDSIGESGASSDETRWGAMTADRKKKYSLSCGGAAASS